MKISAQAVQAFQSKFKDKNETPPKKDGVFVVPKQKRPGPQQPSAQKMTFMMNIFRENMDAAREAAEIQAEEFRKMRIAFEIASRIMRGDNVPQQDLDFLLEQSPGLFKLAMAARRMDNEDAKDHDKALSEGAEGNSNDVVAATVQAVSGQGASSVSSSGDSVA